MDNQDLTTGNLSQLRELAGRSVIEKDGKWTFHFNKPVQGIDTAKTYSSKEEAVEAAFTALKGVSNPKDYIRAA